MMAAPLKGEQVLPPPATLEPDIFLAGMAGHFGISILFAIVMIFVVRGMPTGATIAISLVLSLVLYVIMFHILTPSFPYYAKGRGWIPILMHLVLGLVAGWSYRALALGAAPPLAAQESVIQFPPGYRIEKVVDSLSYATSLTWDDTPGSVASTPAGATVSGAIPEGKSIRLPRS